MTQHSSPSGPAPSDGPLDGPLAVATGRRTKVAPYTAAAIAVVLGLFVWLLATSTAGDDAKVSSPLLGKLTPAVSGTGFRGEPFDIDAERGSWVLVNFFSTTCIPCIQEHPELVELAGRHKGTGAVKIVSITFEDKPAAVREFFEKNGGDWPVLLTDTGRIAISFGVTAVPESYLVAPDGRIARKVIGGITADDVDAFITRIGG
jgi:cytochrome c biogenesis protein CcmG/thiol:disulfide interchange protein DsbE